MPFVLHIRKISQSTKDVWVFVKNYEGSEILPYFQVNKLDLSPFHGFWQKSQTPGTETRAFITYGIVSSRSFLLASVFLVPPVLWQCRVVWMELFVGFVSQWGTSASETLIFFNGLQGNLSSFCLEGKYSLMSCQGNKSAFNLEGDTLFVYQRYLLYKNPCKDILEQKLIQDVQQ